MSLDVFEIQQSSLDKIQAVLEGKEENPERSPLHETEQDHKKVAVSPRHEDDGKKVLFEKRKKKDKEEEELDEKKGEKIIFNPEVHPDRITEPDKVQKTV